MYDEILKQMRAAATLGRVFLTLHANRELKEDGLHYEDIINCLLTGEIIEQQFDADRQEEKYLLYGDAQDGDEMAVVARVGYNDATVIITTFRLRITNYDF